MSSRHHHHRHASRGAAAGMRQRVVVGSSGTSASTSSHSVPASPRSAEGLRERTTTHKHNLSASATTTPVTKKSSWEITTASASDYHAHAAVADPAPLTFPPSSLGSSIGRNLDRYQGLGGRLDTMLLSSSAAEPPQPLMSGNNSDLPQLMTTGAAAAAPPLLTIKPRLEEFHTLYRTALHVPDAQYQNYLRGRYGRRRGGGYFGNDDEDDAICTRTCCGKVGAGFSLVGAAFLLLIGILLDTQPLYIKGTLPRVVVHSDDASKPVTQYLLPQDDERLPMAKTAYQTAFVYLLTAAACLCMLYPPRSSWLVSFWYRRSKRYQDIPDTTAESTIPTFHNPLETAAAAAGGGGSGSPLRGGGGIGNVHLATNNSHDSHDSLGSGGGGGAGVSSSYSPGVWSRTTNRVKQWMAQRGWYSAVKRRPRDKHMPKTI